MNNFIEELCKHTYDAKPTSIEEIVGKGKNNRVFVIEINKSKCILRLKDSEQELFLFEKEKWCAEMALRANIPTPRITEVGVFQNHSFSFQEFIEGIWGIDPLDQRGAIWHTLGQYARIINLLSVPKYEFDYKSKIENLFADNYFVSRNIISKTLNSVIQQRLTEAVTWKFEPRLCHGNLHPSNVILGSNGQTYLIDWETASGNFTPWSELAEIYTWNTGKENIEEFLKGYRLNSPEVQENMRTVQTLILLRLVDVIKRKIEKGTGWETDSYIRETVIHFADIKDFGADVLFTKNL